MSHQAYLELQELEKDTRGSTARDAATERVKAQMIGLGLGAFFRLLVASAHVSLEHVQSLDSVFVPLGIAGYQIASLSLAILFVLVIREKFID